MALIGPPNVGLSTHVLVIIVSNRVIFFLDDIYKRGPSGICLRHSRLIWWSFLPISTPPILDMGDCLKERKGDLFLVEKIVDREYPSRTFNQLYRASASIFPSNKGISKLTCTLNGFASSNWQLVEDALVVAGIRRRFWEKLSIIPFLCRSRDSSSSDLIGSTAPSSLFSSSMGGVWGEESD